MIVLVVDDEPDMKPLFEQRLRRELKSGEMRLVFAGDGESALKNVGCCPGVKPGERLVAFLDMQLPDLSGVELMKKLKAVYPQAAVFVISGMADDGTRRKCLEAGAEGFITKPIDFCELKNYLR